MIDFEHLYKEYSKSVVVVKRELTKEIPELPGVYLMKDRNNTIIYIGKSKSLNKRVKSYFYSLESHTKKVLKMITQIEKIDYICTGTELEALLLESKLIKEEMPMYNRQIRNYKQYPFIKITMIEKYPNIAITNEIASDENRYFGPFSSLSELESILEILKGEFGLRRCTDLTIRSKGCIYREIGQCLSPCIEENRLQYFDTFQKIIKFLEGQNREIVCELEQKRNEFSHQFKFEKAFKVQQTIERLDRFYHICKNYMSSMEKRDLVIVLPGVDETKATVLLVIKGRYRKIYHLYKSDFTDTFLDQVWKDYKEGLKEDFTYITKKDIDEIMIIGRWLREHNNEVGVIKLRKGLDNMKVQLKNGGNMKF